MGDGEEKREKGYVKMKENYTHSLFKGSVDPVYLRTHASVHPRIYVPIIFNQWPLLLRSMIEPRPSDQSDGPDSFRLSPVPHVLFRVQIHVFSSFFISAHPSAYCLHPLCISFFYYFLLHAF